MKKSVYIKSYGCQMNVYDSERMADVLKPLGYALAESAEEADLAILNTCHIREKAEQKVFSDLGRLRDHQAKRREGGDDMVIAVGGCVAQAEGAEITRQAPYVDMVFGPQTYHRLPEMIARVQRSEDQRFWNKDRPAKGVGILDVEFPAEPKFDFLPKHTESRVSAYLSIQEGCDKFCTFCVVPYTRGAEYSRPAQEILHEARDLVSLGAKEITLLGQNVSAYHGESPGDKKEWGLGRLMQELAEIEELKRIRYTTSHPRDMDQELINAHRDIPKLMPCLHLPVQSGSNRILEAMNRKHTREDYLRFMDDLRQARPDIAVTSDFIVGFPGETDQDFLETLSLVKAVGYAQAYSFTYSKRPGTPGAMMDDQVDESVKSERLFMLQSLLDEFQNAFNQKTVGSIQEVLFDRIGKPSKRQILGRGPYMQSVHIEGEDVEVGDILSVKIQSAGPKSVSGTRMTLE